MELQSLRGMGPGRLKALTEAGIESVEDLLRFVPLSYQDRTKSTKIADLMEGETTCVEGFIINTPKVARFKGLSSVTVRIRDDSVPKGSFRLIFYNQPWIAAQAHTGDAVCYYGRVSRDRNGSLCMVCPSPVTERRIEPVYKKIGSVPGKTMRQWIETALADPFCVTETLPLSVRKKYALCEKNFALRQIHFPDQMESLRLALQRVGFEEALIYQAAVRLMRGERKKGVSMQFDEGETENYWNALPFAPTTAQKKALSEIASDLKQSSAMSRMVQGDVGCGKTAVAFGAIWCAFRAGYQSSLMAPTEILAEQHYLNAKEILEPMGVSCGLLTGSLKTAEKRNALEAIHEGKWQVVIGTHALLSAGVEYQHLGLIITDEQHRFGVRHRKMLSDKADMPPHALVMSATPIPRSLALILYGDLDLSLIDELPPGRKPVETRIVPEEKREGLYRFIQEEAQKGHQTYIVCPMVEENENFDVKSAEDTYAQLSRGALQNLRLGLTYGSQPAAEKEEVLSGFREGKLDVLVATTVIEVGVNVPSATVMIIENADRFGLSQLHQLRGRVGRGADKSWCFLMAKPNERLRTLCETNSGFLIAEKDLELRGPGDFLGTRQHGQASLQALALAGNAELLYKTRECLHTLSLPENAADWEQVRKEAERLYARMTERVVMN